MGLTPKEEMFVQGLFKGLSQRLAYKEAYKSSHKWKDTTIDNKAYLLAKKNEIMERLHELRNAVASKNIMSEIELQEWWTEVVKEYDVDIRDKIKASELLGKNKAMFTDKIKSENLNINDDVTKLSKEERVKRIAELKKELGEN